MEKRIVFATSNQDKAKELKEILFDYEILTLKDIGYNDEIEEDGTTFEENALIKARAAFKSCGIVSIADDSGLCVDALDGAPGIYSARYSGGDYTDNNIKLLSELSEVIEENRTAHFACAAALCADGCEQAVTAYVHGKIGFELKGNSGFGYDPLFIEDTTGKTYAEMTADEKNALSHRKRAFEKLKPILDKYFEE